MGLYVLMAKRSRDVPSAETAELPEPGADLQRTFGTNFRARRLAAGMTQDAVAKLTGMHSPDVSAIERGVGNVTLKTMHRLATVVHCRVEVLLVSVGSGSTG